MNGVKLIERERVRQVVDEGWDAEHDAKHTDGELRAAAICYALGNTQFWPEDWDKAYWKPTRDPVRDLTKAGALIAAEIDRLLRQQGHVVAGIPPVAESDDHVRVSVDEMERIAERRREMDQTIREMDARISELNRACSDASVGLASALAEAREAREERDDAKAEARELHDHSSRLVKLLEEEWWVEAADVLNRLRELTGVD